MLVIRGISKDLDEGADELVLDISATKNAENIG
jgi:hypothetical protein